ncbi:Protein of unknown function DUF309 [Dillenia turbinata]|uniref:DUF309 domain-containing protein n=1 Tax=Dillenia turbinata TaxID=194707 RepID=A0AAN8VXC9_9MAGN
MAIFFSLAVVPQAQTHPKQLGGALCHSSSFHPGPCGNPSISVSTHSNNWAGLCVRYRRRYSIEDEDEDEEEENGGFEEAVRQFNSGEYYKCHDTLEAIWNRAEHPSVRLLVHAILQCAVGFHHLFNQNHKGAMMELGEGLCKLRKMHLEEKGGGPFFDFEKDVSATLDFIYHTQLELAACADDFCLTMDRSERSYQLLGGYAAGQLLYHLEDGVDGVIYIVFSPQIARPNGPPPAKVKLPKLYATEQHLAAYN